MYIQMYEEHQDFFMASRMSENNVKVCLRRKEAKERIFFHYGILEKNIGQKLAESISKIDCYMKNDYSWRETGVKVEDEPTEKIFEIGFENLVKKEEVAKEEKK